VPSQVTPSILKFGLFELDRRNFELRRDGQPVKLDRIPLELLCFLVENAGTLVTREQAIERVWGKGVFIEEASLYTAVRKVRRALGDDSGESQLIQTVPRKGYRFIAKVDQITGSLPPSASAPAVRVTPHFRTSWAVLTSILLVLLLLLWLVRSGTLWRSQTSVPMVVRFVQLTNDGQVKSGPVATDGIRIYFNEILPGQLRLPVQVSTRGGEVVHISISLSRARVLDISPDGREILLGNQEEGGANSLWIQPVFGGSPRRVGSELVRDAAWAADGKMIVYGNPDSISLMKENGMLPRKLLSVQGSPYDFRFSPGGDSLRFSLLRFSRHDISSSLHDEGSDSTSIMQASAEGQNLQKLFSGCCGKWTSDGRFFVYSNEQDGRTDLWALAETGGRHTDPIHLTSGPLDFEAPAPSKDGREIFAIGNLRRSEIVRYDRRSREFVSYLAGVSAEGLSFSRDGKWVTYTSYPDGGLWRSKVDGSERLQLAFPPMRCLLPRWSPDGREIAFAAHLPARPWNIYLVPADGGTPQQVVPDAEDRVDANWSADGSSLVFGSFNVSNTPISVVNVKTKQLSTIPGSIGLFSPRWSPDGRYICAITVERPFKLMLFDFATKKWTQLIDSDIGYPNWSHGGRYIYFEVNPHRNQPAEIHRIRISDRKVETIANLANIGRAATGSFVEWSGLAPDDSPLLSRDISTHEIYALQLETR